MSIPCRLRLKGCSAWFIVLGNGLQQVTMGPRSLFSFFLQGQYFPLYLCCSQQCCFLNNSHPHVHANSLHVLIIATIIFIITITIIFYYLTIIIIIIITIIIIVNFTFVILLGMCYRSWFLCWQPFRLGTNKA